MEAFYYDKNLKINADQHFSFIHLHSKKTDVFTFYKQYTHICALPLKGYVQVSSGYDYKKVLAHECVFVRRSPLTKTTFHPDKLTGEFEAIYMELDKEFLVDFFRSLRRDYLPLTAKRFKRICTPLPRTERLERIAKEICNLVLNNEMTLEKSKKLRHKCVEILLTLSNDYYATLFDFYKPYKIGINDYINLIYKQNLSVDEMAWFASRSKAAFKRDVVAATGTSPERAIINTRLTKAHELITQQHVLPKNLHEELGFKSKQHFYSRYKARFNTTPLTDYKEHYPEEQTETPTTTSD